MSTKYPQGIITATPPFKATSGQNYSGVWTLEQLAKNFYYYGTAVPNSLRFRASASAYLNRTPSVSGNRQTWTWSGWVKRGTLSLYRSVFGGYSGTSNGNLRTTIVFNANDQLDIASSQMQVADDFQITTNAVYRDPSAWYHIVVAVDTTQATSTNRIKLYVNGVQVTSFATSNYPTQNYQGGVNATSNQYLARYYDSGAPTNTYFDGYMAEVNFIDGQALTPSSFGSISGPTGVWCPIKYTGTYGTNGFHLDFSNGTSTTTLGYDSSGNSNNWTTNNISLTAGSTYDWMIDSPTSYAGSSYGVGNYAVLNPLMRSLFDQYIPTDGNLSVNLVTNGQAISSIPVTSGKWYAEFVVASGTLSTDTRVGFQPPTTYSTYFCGNSSSLGYAYSADGSKSSNGSFVAYGSTWGVGDIISTALDLDNGKVYWAKNGVWQASGDPVAGTNAAYTGIAGTFCFVLVNGNSATNNKVFNVNFGQRPFSYTPPSGFKSLCTYNLSTPTIQQGNKFMDATLYTGNGSTQTVTGFNFNPDMVWHKGRSVAYSHSVVDVIRGDSNVLLTNTTDAEQNPGAQLALATGGATVTYRSANLANNQSGATYVIWGWKASNAAAVTNTAGSITSQVSANTTAGFSVVTFTSPSSFTNATVGHGLGVAPSMIITKSRTSTGGWVVWHTSLGVNGYLSLDSTSAAGTNSQAYNGTSSTTFTMGSNAWWQAAAQNWVSYCFAAIPGYSAFGSYTGNGSSDGPFVYCGFRPRWVLIKRTDASQNWAIIDTSRDTYNVSNKRLFPNLSDAEDTGIPNFADILSNGFKLRDSNVSENASGGTYIYAAFAESPFNYALAR